MPRPLRQLAHAAVIAFVILPPGAARAVDSGAYLAAQAAAAHSEYGAAARFYSKALLRDPGNVNLLDNTVTAFVGLGQIDSAAPIARRVLATGAPSQVSYLVNAAALGAAGDWGGLLDTLVGHDTVGPLFDGIAIGWAYLGNGDTAAAMASFDEVAATEGVMAFGLYHKALALAALGRFAEAEEIYASDVGGGLRLTRRGVVARVEGLSQLGRNDEAIALIDDSFGVELDAALVDLRARLETGETLPASIARNARDGLAETFYSIATALKGEALDNYTLLYTRLAEYLRPDHVEAVLLTASLLEAIEQYDLAIANYRKIPHTDPASEAAELGRADALRNSGKPDAAIEVMRQLVERNPTNSLLNISLGDSLRALERYDEAQAAYSAAIDGFAGEDASQWGVYFTRGITHERLDRWPEAEADFRKALDLNPDQPQVLNYLGYSLVEMHQDLDEALGMIQRAVAARPDSGYITDSLGWVFYRLGRYEEAVDPMERAIELMPIDPVVNDHLGDVYWAVGRYREAEFQWKRALSFIDRDDSGEADPDRIRLKLEVGLDQVLADEAETPHTVANDGG